MDLLPVPTGGKSSIFQSWQLLFKVFKNAHVTCMFSFPRLLFLESLFYHNTYGPNRYNIAFILHCIYFIFLYLWKAITYV